MSLTRKQRVILDAIIFLIRRGELPTVREVGALVGLRSPATVLKHLRALEAEKLITISGKSRGIRIADPDLLAQLLEEDALEPGAARTATLDPATDRRTPDVAATRDEKRSGTTGDGGLLEGKPFQDTAHTPDESVRGGILQGHFGKIAGRLARRVTTVPVVGAIAAGRPIETKPEAFSSSMFEGQPSLAIDPQMFGASGELLALRVEGDSMIGAGILDGDYAIIRRQNNVEEGEIAAVLVDGEATLKRWHHSRGFSGSGGRSSTDSRRHPHTSSDRSTRMGRATSERLTPEKKQETVRLVAANERFESLEITERDRKEVFVVGKYVGLVRGAQTL